MTVDLENNLLKAKIVLMTKSVFLSTICLSVRQIITDSVPTAATNNLNIFYNPDFIKNMPIAELAGLMAHECWHIAFMHLLRRLDRDPLDWNAAGDHVINLMLLKAGFQIPAGGLQNSAYTDMGTDEVYDIIHSNPPPDGYGSMILDIQGNMAGEGDGAGETEDQIKAKVTDILVRAHTQAKISGTLAGEIPGEILRTIDELLNPKVPWEIVLNRFLDQRIREEYSWARRNRRHDVYMPSLYSYGLGHLIWAIDTSGSQDDEALTRTRSEIQGVRDMLHPEKMTILDCDYKIHNVYEIDAQTDIMSLEFHGGGGTSFLPVLEYVKEHPAQALIYFTDLYGEDNLDPVDYPILWLCNSNHKPANIGETVYVEI